MSDRLIEILLRLAPRERALLGLLFLVVLPVALWLGWLAPLADRRETALQALQETRALNIWVQERAEEQTRLLQANASGPGVVIGISGVEQSLISAGLRDPLSELSNRDGDAIKLRFDAVPFEDFARWLASSDPGWGYDISALHIERSAEPGIVLVDMTLVPQG